jgi:hypothetical protein
MNGYVEAGYVVTLASLGGYALSLRLRGQRALREEAIPVRDEDPDTER